MKEYFKMYGLNFVDVSPEEFANITDKDPKVLYVVSPQGYNNYTGSYNVNLYLGNTKLDAVSDIKNESVNVWDLSEGIYKIYGKLIYSDNPLDTIGLLDNNIFGLLLTAKPTPDSVLFTYLYNNGIYIGKTSTINGAHIKDYFNKSNTTNTLKKIYSGIGNVGDNISISQEYTETYFNFIVDVVSDGNIIHLRCNKIDKSNSQIQIEGYGFYDSAAVEVIIIGSEGIYNIQSCSCGGNACTISGIYGNSIPVED